MFAAIDSGVGGHKLTAPAMPTLKLWSKEGVFRSAMTLSKAADIAAARVFAQPGRFKATGRRAALLPEVAVTPATVHLLARTSGTSEPTDVGHQPNRLAGSADTISELQALRADMAALTFRFSELQKISDMAYSSILRMVPLVQAQAAASQQSTSAPNCSSDSTGSTSSSDAVLAELTRGIDQLDAVRKHVLLSLDRETQAMRQQSSAIQQRSQDGVSPLDVQRILARLSNVEQQSIQIVQLLHEKVKQ